MVGSVVRLVSCIALVSVALVVIPARTPAQQSQPTMQYFETAITGVYGSPYPIAGRLKIEVFPGGHLRGYYHTAYDRRYNIQVAGGRDGDYIWFDIGPSSEDLGLGSGPQGKLHVVATMDSDGSFKGQVYPETAAVLSGPAMQLQQANPQPTGSNDQYIFAATPAPADEQTPSP